MVDYAPGMRVIIRDEEWMIKKCDTNTYGSKTLQCIGISSLVKDKSAYFLSDLEKMRWLTRQKQGWLLMIPPIITAPGCIWKVSGVR